MTPSLCAVRWIQDPGLWIQVGLMAIHDQQQRALLHGELLDEPLSETSVSMYPAGDFPLRASGTHVLLWGLPAHPPL